VILRTDGLPDKTLRKILVFNFFNGVKERGIPVYARELEHCFERVGIRYVELACPAWARALPAPLLNVLFVVFEQFVAPVAAFVMGCRATVYPYNSAAIIDALLDRAILVVHDLMPNARTRRGGLAASYIRSTQSVHCALRRPVCAVSEHTLKSLRRLRPYAGCPLYLWSNPFYGFERVVQAARASSERCDSTRRASAQVPRVLLCSGLGSNKDFVGALRLFERSAGRHDAQLRVLGFGSDAFLAMRRLDRCTADLAKRVTVLQRLSIEQVAREYLESDVVWVHSTNEGFGRPIIEARMSGRPVLASDITAFRKLARLGHVSIYRDESFTRKLADLLAQAQRLQHDPISAEFLHQQLESSVMRVMQRHFGICMPSVSA
jgi:glycosyltransferase involved in cell wall biosynthesis